MKTKLMIDTKFVFNDKLLIKGYYNRFVAEIWMWVIFFEWIFRLIKN
jgi:hypothetical protein